MAAWTTFCGRVLISGTIWFHDSCHCSAHPIVAHLHFHRLSKVTSTWISPGASAVGNAGKTGAEAEAPSSATWCEEPTHWERLWCWERLRGGGEGGSRGWDGYMASPTQSTWVWVNSGRWWRTAWRAAVHGIAQLDTIERLSNNLLWEAWAIVSLEAHTLFLSWWAVAMEHCPTCGLSGMEQRGLRNKPCCPICIHSLTFLLLDVN